MIPPQATAPRFGASSVRLPGQPVRFGDSPALVNPESSLPPSAEERVSSEPRSVQQRFQDGLSEAWRMGKQALEMPKALWEGELGWWGKALAPPAFLLALIFEMPIYALFGLGKGMLMGKPQ